MTTKEVKQFYIKQLPSITSNDTINKPALRYYATYIKTNQFHFRGRMGRLWQPVILMRAYPLFEFLPFETMIRKTQEKYYHALTLNDKSGKSTLFLEYMLNVFDKSLGELLKYKNRVLTGIDRLEYFIKSGVKEFTEKII